MIVEKGILLLAVKSWTHTHTHTCAQDQTLQNAFWLEPVIPTLPIREIDDTRFYTLLTLLYRNKSFFQVSFCSYNQKPQTRPVTWEARGNDLTLDSELLELFFSDKIFCLAGHIAPNSLWNISDRPHYKEHKLLVFS